MIQMRFTADSAAEFGLPNTASVIAAFRYTQVCDEPEGGYDGKTANFFVVADGHPAKVVIMDRVWHFLNISERDLRDRGAIDSGSIHESPCGCITQYLSEKEVMEFLEYPIDIQQIHLDPVVALEDLLDELLRSHDD